MTRLLTQGLRDLGLMYVRLRDYRVWLTGSKSAEMVEQESGLSLESSHVKKFRQALLSGDYDRVESLLSSLGIKEDSEPVSSFERLTWF